MQHLKKIYTISLLCVLGQAVMETNSTSRGFPLFAILEAEPFLKLLIKTLQLNTVNEFHFDHMMSLDSDRKLL